MSSLLQFNGTVSRRGVDLQFCLIRKVSKVIGEAANVYGPLNYGSPDFVDRGFVTVRDEYVDVITDPATGRTLPRLAIATRRPCGMFGCWVVFRYLGAEHVPDLSVPISVERLPRGARVCSNAETIALWNR